MKPQFNETHERVVKAIECILQSTIAILIIIILYASIHARHIVDDCLGHFVFEIDGKTFQCVPVNKDSIPVPNKKKLQF